MEGDAVRSRPKAIEGRIKPTQGAVDAEDLGTLRHEPAGHRQPDATTDPGDQRDFALESSTGHDALPMRFLWQS